MNPLVRRRTAIGAGTAALALVVGLVVAPQVHAATGGLRIVPNGAPNTGSTDLTFNSTDADFTFGGTASFTRIGGGQPFLENIAAPTPPPVPSDTSQKQTVDFTDVGTGVGSDGPADAGTYSVTVQGNSGPNNAGGTARPGGTDTCTSCFTVLSGGPVSVASISPTNLGPGKSMDVTIAGNNFERGSAIAFLYPDGSVDNNVTANAAPTDASGAPLTSGITTRTQLQRTASVATAASPGARSVRVTNLDGNSSVCTNCFFVSGAPLTTISPTAAYNDPTQGLTSITFNGSNITDGAPRLEFVGTPGSTSRNALTIPGTRTGYSGTSITADFDLRNAAPNASGYQPVVEGSGGVLNACDCRFTVTQRNEPPTLTSLDSDTATVGIQKDIQAGTTVTFTATGTNFSKGVNFTFSGTGLTLTKVDFVDPQTANITVAAAKTATTGAQSVTAVLTDGSKSAACSNCINVTAASSASPSSSSSPSATATSTISPRPTSCPVNGLTVRVNTKTINATGQASVTVSGASDSATVELEGYSQDHYGKQSFANDPTPVDRTGKASSSGAITFNDLRPASNTRLRARQAGCTYNGNSDVINVRAQETLQVARTSALHYTFSGKSIPARPGGLIISLYRITGNACPAGVEPKDCPGETLIGQGRARSDNGQYSIPITFKTADRNTRDDFVVKTGQDAQNAPGRSNSRNLAIS